MISEEDNSQTRKSVAALIVAAGKGTRVGGDIPKQFLFMQGKRVLDWSIETCVKHPTIRQTVVVLPSQWLPLIKDQWDGQDSLNFVEGGETRTKSVKAGLENLQEIDQVLVHDAARPGINNSIIETVLAGLENFNGVAPVIEISDTLKRVRNNVVTTVNRSEYFRTQTPQGFDLRTLRSLLRTTKKNYTDELQVIEESGEKVGVVTGQSRLSKLTYQEDIENYRFVLGSES